MKILYIYGTVLYFFFFCKNNDIHNDTLRQKRNNYVNFDQAYSQNIELYLINSLSVIEF